jgi:hypothetical protein
MIGTNRLNFTIPGNMPPGQFRFSALPALSDPFGQPLDGNADGIGGDALTRSFTLVPATNPYIVNLSDGQIVSNAHFGNHDVAPPRALLAQFSYLTSQSLVLSFNENLTGSLGLEDLVLENLTSGQRIDTDAFSLSWLPIGNTAVISVNGILPDGNYRATLSSASVTDPSGNPLDGDGNGIGGDDLIFHFYFLQADVNRDRIVNLRDFNILGANFGLSEADFEHGDLNYDGTVDLRDFDIMAGRFGQAVGGSQSPPFFGDRIFSDPEDQLGDLLV